MIDTHIHLLPGVDDGASDIEVAMQMLRLSNNEGVSEMIVTPHFNIPLYNNQNVDKQYNVIKDYISSEKIDIKVHLGNEIYLSEEDIEGIKMGQAHTMGSSRYLLIELPFYHFYPFHEAMIYDLQLNGYKILLAHVERNQVFMKKPEKIKELVRKGIYAQMTSEFIIDCKTRKRALQWIEEGLIHIIASDGHDVDSRPPIMKYAYDIVTKVFGMDCAQLLFVDNPRSLIEDGALTVANIEKVKRFYWYKNTGILVEHFQK